MCEIDEALGIIIYTRVPFEVRVFFFHAVPRFFQDVKERPSSRSNVCTQQAWDRWVDAPNRRSMASADRRPYRYASSSSNNTRRSSHHTKDLLGDDRQSCPPFDPQAGGNLARAVCVAGGRADQSVRQEEERGLAGAEGCAGGVSGTGAFLDRYGVAVPILSLTGGGVRAASLRSTEKRYRVPPPSFATNVEVL